MKRYLILLILSGMFISCFAEGELSISELEMICCNKKWPDAISYVTKKPNWIFYESKTIDKSDKVIVLAYNVDPYEHDHAEGFLNIYTDGNNDDEITQISYIHYSNSTDIENQLVKKGYKKTDAQLDNDIYSIEYSSNKADFYVKSEKYDNGYLVKERITYNLIKKGGKDDLYNGHKLIYDEEIDVWIEFTLKDGKKIGTYTISFNDGKKTKYIFNNGEVIEINCYDTSSRLISHLKRIKDDIFYITYYAYNDDGKLIDKIEGKISCLVGDSETAVLHYLDRYKYCDYIETTYQDDKVSTTTHFRFNENIGQITKTDKNGNVILSVSQYEDTLNGECRWYIYDDNGHLSVEKIGYYKMGDLDGKIIRNEYYGDSTKIEFCKNYSNGLEHGPTTLTVVNNGKRQIVGKMNYVRGKIVGEYIWNRHDTLEIEHYNSNGDAHGEFSVYKCLKMCEETDDVPLSIDSKNIVLISKGSYKDGLETGVWVKYNDNGSVETKEYEDGVLHGKISFVDNNGNVLNYGSFYHGEMDGLWHKYSWEEDLYGRSLDSCLYDKGKWVKSILSKGDSTYRYYSKNIKYSMRIVCELYIGKILKERKTYLADDNLNLLNGGYIGFPLDIDFDTLDGLCEFYDDKGRCLSRGLYKEDKKYGGWYDYLWNDDLYVYSSSSGLWIIKTISKDKPFNGKFKLEDSGFLYIYSVKNGLRHGKAIVKDVKSQKVVRYLKFKNGVLVKEWDKK